MGLTDGEKKARRRRGREMRRDRREMGEKGLPAMDAGESRTGSGEGARSPWRRERLVS